MQWEIVEYFLTRTIRQTIAKKKEKKTNADCRVEMRACNADNRLLKYIN